MTGSDGSVMADAARNRLAVALDTDDLDRAVGLARQVAPWFAVAKVGLELWAAAGPGAVERLSGCGLTVFCDVKLHDIPTTVARAARVIGRLGVAYVTLHASGGVEMLRAGIEGLAQGASDARVAAPCALGVTVLTSEADASPFDARLAAAVEAGCGGVVCSTREIAAVKAARSGLIAVVPGIRPAGSSADDQARVGTPGEAVLAGADVLVIGRPVTAARDPGEAARLVSEEVAEAVREL